MHCEVQLLYSSGTRLQAPSRPWVGEFTLRNGRADLTGADREPAVPCLVHARVTKVTAQGIVVVGTELVPRNPASSKSNVDRYPQTWWCRLLPGQLEYLPPRPREMPKWRQAFIREESTGEKKSP